LFVVWCRSFITDPDTRTIVIGLMGFVAVAVIGDVVLFRPPWNRSLMTAGATLFSEDQLKLMSRDRFMASRGISPAGKSIVNPCLFYREGLNSAVSVESNFRNNLLFLKNDGKTEAAIAIDPTKKASGSDANTHALLGALPVALHKGDCRRVLVIG